MDKGIERLKKEAAALGANGVLLQNTSSEGGAGGVGTGVGVSSGGGIYASTGIFTSSSNKEPARVLQFMFRLNSCATPRYLSVVARDGTGWRDEFANRVRLPLARRCGGLCEPSRVTQIRP